MFEASTFTRVRYSDCDPMGIVYHGNYAQFFETGRTEAFRDHHFSYKKLEDEEGIAMAVVEMKSRFSRPARYDDLITIKTSIREMPGRKMIFHSELYNEAGELLTTGEITFVFVRKDTLKRCEAPQYVLSFFKPYFDEIEK
jgi:acyl-CoA thioester hydrolase